MSANENHIAEAISAPAFLRDGGALCAETSDLLVNQLHRGKWSWFPPPNPGVIVYSLVFVGKPLLFLVCLLSLQNKSSCPETDWAATEIFGQQQLRERDGRSVPRLLLQATLFLLVNQSSKSHAAPQWTGVWPDGQGCSRAPVGSNLGTGACALEAVNLCCLAQEPGLLRPACHSPLWRESGVKGWLLPAVAF